WPPSLRVTRSGRRASTDSRRSVSLLESVTVTFAPERTRKRVTPRPPPKRPRPITVTRFPSSAGRSRVRGRTISFLGPDRTLAELVGPFEQGVDLLRGDG